MGRWLGFLVAAAVLTATVGTSSESNSVRTSHAALVSAPTTNDLSTAAVGDTSSPDSSGCFQALPERRLKALRRLPWPVVLTTSCGRFAAFPNGQLTRARVDPGLTPDPGYRIPAGRDAWAGVRGGHVVFVRRGRVVWRSTGTTFEANQVDSAALARNWVAFIEYGVGGDLGRMYFAGLDRPERVVALNEAPLTSTAWNGLISSRWRDNGDFDLLARGPDGSLLRVVATHVSYGMPQPDGTVVFRKGRTFIRTDGRTKTVIATTSGLGLRRQVGLEVLSDGRLVVFGPNRLRLLAADGRVEASATVAPIPKGGWGYLGFQMTLQPHTRAVFFTATHGADRAAGGGPGWEGVYKLTPGAVSAMLLFGRRLSIAICAHASSMHWRGSWLLYSACEGRVVAIDTTGRNDPVVLTSAARSVPVPEEEREYGLYGADWAPFGPEAMGRPISLR
jgi:hypothetical protein